MVSGSGLARGVTPDDATLGLSYTHGGVLVATVSGRATPPSAHAGCRERRRCRFREKAPGANLDDDASSASRRLRSVTSENHFRCRSLSPESIRDALRVGVRVSKDVVRSLDPTARSAFPSCSPVVRKNYRGALSTMARRNVNEGFRWRLLCECKVSDTSPSLVCRRVDGTRSPIPPIKRVAQSAHHPGDAAPRRCRMKRTYRTSLVEARS